MNYSYRVLKPHFETILPADRPILAVEDIDGDSSLEFLVGVRELHVTDEHGSDKWSYPTRGTFQSLVTRYSLDSSAYLALSTDRVFDAICGSADAISILCHEGYVYLFTAGGEQILKTSHQGEITNIAVWKSHDGTASVLIGTADLDAQNRIIFLDQTGQARWALVTPGQVSALFVPQLSSGIFLAGTGQGKLLAVSDRGQLIWQQQVGNTRLVDIRFIGSPQHGEYIMAVTRSGHLAAFSSDGQILWQNNASPIATVVCVRCGDINNDGETEIVVGSRTAISCYDFRGNSLWNTPLEKSLHSFDLLCGRVEDQQLLLACTGSSGVILRAGDGAFLGQLLLGGHGLACKSVARDHLNGWIVCRARPAENRLWRILGHQDIDLLFIQA